MYVATIRQHQRKKCQLKGGKELRKRKQRVNDFQMMCDANIIIAQWFDNKPVNFFIGMKPVDNFK